jgi:hypothetical protein
MLISEVVIIKVHNYTKKHYISKGYDLSKLKVGDEFTVKVKDLPLRSNCAIVKIKCDYCGKKFERSYDEYTSQNKTIQKDACSDCRILKSQEAMLYKYGAKCSMLVPEINEKILEFNHNRKLDLNFVYNEFKKLNYIPLFEVYNSCRQRLPYVCSAHPNKVRYITYNKLQQGERCADCSKEKNMGENHHNWNGGVSSLSEYLRSNINDWKFKSMQEYNYKCVITGKTMDVIHHLYSFNKIVKETLKITKIPLYKEINKYSNIELENLKQVCLELHFKYGLGVCLTNEIHSMFHKKYGRNNNTLEQFEQFEQFKYFIKGGEKLV